jgi:zinc transporter ZupT
MNPIVFLLAVATFFSTLFGGMVILKFKKYLHYFFAFAAGSIISVAFLDLFPESLDIASSSGIPARTIMLLVVFSFFFYSFIERFFFTHHMHDGENHGHIMGPIGAGSLIIHSMLDGVAIGVAFQASAAVGLIIALAVIFHDMTDGVNTVAIMLKNKHSAKKARVFLLMDALAPLAGILVVSATAIPEVALAYILAIFVGEFLYIGAVSMLHEIHGHRSLAIALAIVFGVALITILTSFL